MNSYCPYSRFSVKCTIRTEDNKTYKGVNVENASYGLTSCAESNAMASYISEGRNASGYDIKEIRIETDCAPSITPCGACRQILSEHIPGHVPIICIGSVEKKKYYIRDLLPYPFRLSKL